MFLVSQFACFWFLLNTLPGDTVKLKTRSHQFYTVKDTFSGPYFISNYYGVSQKMQSMGKDPESVYYSSWKAGSGIRLNGTTVGWMLLVSPYDCDLTFEIIPIDTTAEFYFSLYKYRKDIHANFHGPEEQRIKPLRQNVSFDLSNKARKGLSLTAKDENVPFKFYRPKMPPYSKFVNVNSQDSFLLAVAVYRNKAITDPFYFRITYNNKSFCLNNVLFETNKTELLSGSFGELNILVAQLKDKTSMQIEVRGHTDNVGDETQNQILSEGRAKAVYDYLITKGVDKNQISYKGFGSKNPKAKNDSEAGKKKNRRVEMVILKE